MKLEEKLGWDSWVADRTSASLSGGSRASKAAARA